MALQVIDSHFHIWDPALQDIPWLASLPKLQRRFTIGELVSRYAALGIEFLGGVYVEVDAADPQLEDRLIHDNGSPFLLKRMLRTRVSPYMRIPAEADGVREPLHIDSEPRGRVLEPEFIAGLRTLASRGMPFELCNRGEELPDMATAFAQVPELTLIIDHLGNMPGLDADSVRAMRTLAQLPNAYIKVSGDNPVDPDIVRFVRDTFDPGHILFSSNWPVVELNSSLNEHVVLMLALFGQDEGFFRDNAARAYGITP